jgi:ribosomal protein S18 acetylase RimI-like enzyme
MIIKQFSPENEKNVIALWKRCGLSRPQNDPHKDITRKMKVNPELFLVGVEGNKVIATAMGGYEGHRGWVNYLGVDPDYQKQGFGRQIMEALEKELLSRGCPKINLQVMKDNLKAAKFYERIGYKEDPAISMGKRLIPD